MNQSLLGRFTFVLHSHLPYVLAHGRWPHGMVWLSEAASECYIPLWRVFRNLHDKGMKLPVTMGITPVLAEQWADPSFSGEFIEYLQMKQKAAVDDLKTFQKEGNRHYASLAQYWIDYYQGIEADFRGPIEQNLVKAFRDLQDEGALEIITSAATHGYLPLLGTDEAVDAQVRTGVESYRRHFGRDPKGIWLPECAYRPGYHWISPTDPEGEGFDRVGVEQVLQKYGIRYFIVDSHMIKGGKAIGVYLERFEGLKKLWEQAQEDREKMEREEILETSPYRLHWVAGTTGEKDPVCVLTRDEETSLQVWSGEYGYPGDGNYLDFHKKRFPGGHRYWRVTRSTADLGEKEVYHPENIERRLEENAEHYVSIITNVLRENTHIPVEDRVVTSPFDTELFGHWWFEGPRWLEKVITVLNRQDAVIPSTGKELVASVKQAPVVELPEGSWGEGGFHYIWYNNDTKWTWPPLHESEKEMTRCAREYEDRSGLVHEILTQMGRVLLLMESSDWQFLISTVSARDYAELRFREHLLDFEFLRDLLERVAAEDAITAEDWERYRKICERDSLFPDLDPASWV